MCTLAESPREKLKVRDVTDGLSQTIALGESAYFNELEKYPFWIGAVQEDESAIFETKAWMIVNCGVQTRDLRAIPDQAVGDTCSFSWHVGGVFFCMGDGSVQFINEEIDYETYKKLGDIADGEVIADRGF